MNLSVQEQDLNLFLDSVGVRFPLFDPSLEDDFVIIRLDPLAGALFEAMENKAVLLAYRIRGKVFPISIIFLKQNEGVSFCHSTLLLESYTDGDSVIPRLRKAVEDFFALDFNVSLGKLEPSWVNVLLTGQLDCRIFWNLKPGMTIVTDLLLEKLGEIPEIPLFPTVYYYDNPYDQNLLEAALPDMSDCPESLMLGTGAGLEAVCVALKYGTPVDAIDINPIAVANTVAAGRRTGTEHLIHAWISDGFEQVQKTYDAILFEAPLATENILIKDPNRYDLGGELLRKILGGLPAYLKPGGRMYLMSCPDLSPYVHDNGLQWKVLRRFKAKSQVAIHKLWVE